MSDPYAARLRAAYRLSQAESAILQWLYKSHPKSPLTFAHMNAKAALDQVIDEDRKRREGDK